MAYRSGEFSIPAIGYRPVPQAVAYFDRRLWVIGQDGNNNVMQTTLALETTDGKTIDLQGDAAKTPSNWTHSDLDIPTAPNGRPRTSSRCAATPVGDALYLFWSNWQSTDTPCILMASRYTVTGDGAMKWGTALTLQDTSGRALLPTIHIPVRGGSDPTNVAATPFGTDTVIVAGACVQNMPSGQPPNWDVYVGAFNVNDIDQRNDIWQARVQFRLPYAQLESPEYWYLGEPRLQISIDWFNSSAGPDGSPPYWLWVSLSRDAPSDPTPGAGTTFFVPLDSSGNPSSGAISGFYPDRERYGCFAVRDPAGRMRTYVNRLTEGGGLSISSYNTRQPIQPDTGQPPLPVVVEQFPAAHDATTPSVAFFTDMKGGQPCTVKDPKGNDRPGTQYPVYEFIVYLASNVKCQVNLYGYAQVFEDYESLTPVPKNKNTFIIAGIVDGPIPVPDANFVGAVFESTQPNFGIVSYSSTDTRSATHTVSNSVTFGFQSQGQVSKGAGVGWNVAVNGGPAYTNGTAKSTSIATTRTQDSLLEIGENLPKPKMLPAGTVFCTDAVIRVTAYRFVDPDGDPISDSTSDGKSSQAPLFVSMRTTFSDSVSQSYLPYAVTPGDLKSYQPDMLNARMKALSRPGDPYVDDRYFEDVVVPNAYTFKDGTNYLEFEWSASSTATTSFQATNSTFTEQGWTMTASAYVGVSGGWDVNVLGLGSAGTFAFLVGGTYSHTANSTSDTTTGWGISINAGTEGRIGPPYPTGSSADPSRVSSYTFRLYFLPPPVPPKLAPNYWVQELQTHLSRVPPPPNPPFPLLMPEEIDPNAAAWKIVYVVTSWRTQADQYTYPT